MKINRKTDSGMVYAKVSKDSVVTSDKPFPPEQNEYQYIVTNKPVPSIKLVVELVDDEGDDDE